MADITLIPDSEKVKLTNMMDSPAGYKLPSGLFRRFAPSSSITVTAGEVREASNMPGTLQIFQNYIRVENKDLAQELGISDDMFTHEYSWTKKDVEAALTTQPIEVLQDALEFAPDAVKEMLVDTAVALEIPDVNRRKAIQEATGQNITKMIEVKNSYKTEEKSEKPASQSQRRATQPAKKTASTSRRATTTKKAEE